MVDGIGMTPQWDACIAPVLEVAHLQTINGYSSLPKFQAIHHVIS
jgi:hypothetical protein